MHADFAERQEVARTGDAYDQSIEDMRAVIIRLDPHDRDVLLEKLRRIKQAVDDRLAAQYKAHMADFDAC